MTQVAVQLRVPKQMLDQVDRWVKGGRFANRSDAIRVMVAFYEEREKTKEFARMLTKRREEALAHPEKLVPLDE